jgi:hypothetical protein
MASNGRKLLKCDKCDNEVEVAVESKSCICYKCLTGGLSLSSIKEAREEKKEAKKEEVKAKKEAKKNEQKNTTSGTEQLKKKRGRPGKN